MIAKLLSSKPKSRLVNLFLAHPGRSFSLTELRMTTGCPAQLLASTIREMMKMGFISAFERQRHRYYQVNKHFALYPELVAMLRKIKNTPKDLLVRQAERVGDCRFIALTGVFAGRPRVETDALFVGKISPAKLQKFLKLAQKFAESEIGYTVFSPQEFEYRKIMNDRFVKDILENNPVVVCDRTKNRNLAKLVYKL